jgi:hypothetical protein
MGTGSDFPNSEAAKREADHSSPSSVIVQNSGAMPALPNTSSWHSAYLIKQRDNFTFTCQQCVVPARFDPPHRLTFTELHGSVLGRPADVPNCSGLGPAFWSDVVMGISVAFLG